MPLADKQDIFKKPSGRVAFCALLTALSMILSYVDSLIPILPSIPGIKLGLANLVILIALYMAGAGYALLINIVRVLLTGFLFTGATGILYSMAGALLSFLVMYILKRTSFFSVIGVSLAGGAAHNIGQLIIAAVLISDTSVFYYLPVLIISGCLSGTVTGIFSHVLIQRLNLL